MAKRHSRFAQVGEYKSLRVNATGTVVPVGNCVSTTAPTTITAGNGVVVTPASMSHIVQGILLNFANGTGTAEDVIVLSVTSTTFTANFVNGHSGAYNITSRKGISLGSVVINKAGTGDTITLYDGSPNLLPDAGTAFAVITPAFGTLTYHGSYDKGLFYTVAGTPGEYTINYLDQDL